MSKNIQQFIEKLFEFINVKNNNLGEHKILILYILGTK